MNSQIHLALLPNILLLKNDQIYITSDYYFAINEKREGILQNFKAPRDLVPEKTRLIL